MAHYNNYGLPLRCALQKPHQHFIRGWIKHISKVNHVDLLRQLDIFTTINLPHAISLETL